MIINLLPGDDFEPFLASLEPEERQQISFVVVGTLCKNVGEYTEKIIEFKSRGKLCVRFTRSENGGSLKFFTLH